MINGKDSGIIETNREWAVPYWETRASIRAKDGVKIKLVETKKCQ